MAHGVHGPVVAPAKQILVAFALAAARADLAFLQRFRALLLFAFALARFALFLGLSGRAAPGGAPRIVKDVHEPADDAAICAVFLVPVGRGLSSGTNGPASQMGWFVPLFHFNGP